MDSSDYHQSLERKFAELWIKSVFDRVESIVGKGENTG